MKRPRNLQLRIPENTYPLVVSGNGDVRVNWIDDLSPLHVDYTGARLERDGRVTADVEVWCSGEYAIAPRRISVSNHRDLADLADAICRAVYAGRRVNLDRPLDVLDAHLQKMIEVGAGRAWREMHRNGSTAASIRDVSTLSEPGPRRFAIDNLEVARAVSGYFGTEGVLKTYFAILRALCRRTGQPFAGFPVHRVRAVLYLDWELNEEEFRRRLWHVARGMGLETPPSRVFYRRMTAPLLDSLDIIRADLAAKGVRDLTIDSLSFAGVTNEETAVQAIGALGLFSVTVAVFDHQARVQTHESYEGKLPYGSRFKEAGYSSLWQLEAGAGGDRGATDILFRDKKFRAGQRRQQFAIRARFEDDSVSFAVIDPAQSTALVDKLPAPQRIIAALRRLGEATVAQIVDETGLAKGTVGPKLSALKRRGQVESVPGLRQNDPHSWRLLAKASARPRTALAPIRRARAGATDPATAGKGRQGLVGKGSNAELEDIDATGAHARASKKRSGRAS